MIATVELVDSADEASLGLFDFLRVPMTGEEIVIGKDTTIVEGVTHYIGGASPGGARVRVYITKLEPF